jgi:hypothetical protein
MAKAYCDILQCMKIVLQYVSIAVSEYIAMESLLLEKRPNTYVELVNNAIMHHMMRVGGLKYMFISFCEKRETIHRIPVL